MHLGLPEPGPHPLSQGSPCPHPPCLLVMPWVSPSLSSPSSPQEDSGWEQGRLCTRGHHRTAHAAPPPPTGPAEGGVTDAPGWTRLCPRGGHLGQSLSRAEQSLEGGYEGRVLGQTMGPVRSNHSPQSLQRKQGGTQCPGWPLGSGP